MRDPDFRAALHEAEAVALAEVSRGLVALASAAIGTVAATLTDPETSPAVRLRAADVTLGRLLQVRELVSLEERLTELEARLAGDGTR